MLLNSAGKALNSLQLSERNRHTHLHVFRNVHVIIEHHKTFCDYVDVKRGIDVGPVGETYINDKAAFHFVSSIA